MSQQKIKVGISVGDLNGIGMEIIIRSMLDNRLFHYCTPIVYGSQKLASFTRKMMALNDFSFQIIKQASEANPKKANLLSCWEEDVQIQYGTPTAESAAYALKSLQAAVDDLKKGEIDVLVTAPIEKSTIQSDQFRFPGHTEYLESVLGGKSLMLLTSDTLKVALVTGHIPLQKVAENLSQAKILERIQQLHQTLTVDFSKDRPRIAVLGLNPHAGDSGLLGSEDRDILAPAIQQAREKGILAFGPYASDGFFGNGTYYQFDAVLAMYHDQGLIPFKAIAFDEGVNYTAGLPFIRTSPDHGTAFDIAGKGKARSESFLKAIYEAVDRYRSRKDNLDLLSNALVISPKGRKEEKDN